MKKRKYRFFVGDFETTVYKGQVHTEVWASALVELYKEDVRIDNSLNDTFDYLRSLKDNVIIYYHNLKFDGSFWLSYLLTELHLTQAYYVPDAKKPEYVEWYNEKDMPNNSFKYTISDKGQWYTITIKMGYKFIEIRDSLKLLPFSVKRIGKAFKTKHKKLDMEYVGFRYAGCEITPEEREYIANDVLVVKEALEIMFEEGHDKLTIGSCCLEEYKRIMGKEDYTMFYPDTTEMPLDKDVFGYSTVDEYIRRSYRGGWCYLVKGKEGKIFENGITADVNSLYPSMMHSESGNYYPVGEPNFWTGNIIPDEALKGGRYYFIRIRTRFYIKHNMLPFIQIKNNYLYKGTESLSTTDVYNPETDSYSEYYLDSKGNVKDTRVELVLTCTDYQLLKDHYELVDFEIIDGCWFFTEIGLFDEYINKYREQKINSEGAKREQAKLFLNNLYGKMASSTDSSFKLAFEKDNSVVGFKQVIANNKTAGYIPVGSAITSYARNFTIRCAQKNYHGVDQRGFIYADTDSVHCDLSIGELQGAPIHKSAFCHWSHESTWDKAIFVRQKTYIEHVIEEDGKPIDEPFYTIKCAGMPDKCKNLFEMSLPDGNKEKVDKLTEEEQAFVNTPRELTDFKIGLRVMGKLRPKRIRGGILLEDSYYQMR